MFSDISVRIANLNQYFLRTSLIQMLSGVSVLDYKYCQRYGDFFFFFFFFFSLLKNDNVTCKVFFFSLLKNDKFS